jgi:hypothetical protein
MIHARVLRTMAIFALVGTVGIGTGASGAGAVPVPRSAIQAQVSGHRFRVPPPRRLTVTFLDAARGIDSMIVRYYEPDGSGARRYVCTNPTESLRVDATEVSETVTSNEPCTAGNSAHHFATRVTRTPAGGATMSVRIYYARSVSYRFVCRAPSARSERTAAGSFVTRTSSRTCTVDQSTPEANACGSRRPPPTTYRHVVVIMEENRTWAQVGGVGFLAMPYAHHLATQCTTYATWLETDSRQNSLTQYIGLTSGVDDSAVWGDCVPSTACRSTADNIFRQVRDSGGTARTFVEGARKGCDGATHPANVAALYYFGGDDHSFCAKEVRPLTEMNVDALPTFAMIVPNRCDNGHDCRDGVVDKWLRRELRKIMTGADYRAGTTAIFVIYDEDRPLPNLVIAPTAHRGLVTNTVASHRDALRTFEDLLGLPILPPVRDATSLRASAHI